MKKSVLAILLLIAISVVAGVMYWINLEYVMTREVTEMVYGEQFRQQGVPNAQETIDMIYEQSHKWWLPMAIFMALVEAGKIFFWAAIVFAGFYTVSKKKYWEIFPAAVIAETAKILQSVVVNVNLIAFNPPTSVAQMSSVPFSLMSFFNPEKLDLWMVQALSAVNIFEVLYILLFAWVLSKDFDEPMGRTSKVVLYTYGLLSVLYVAASVSMLANMPQLGK